MNNNITIDGTFDYMLDDMFDNKLDVIFALDTTASMSSWINRLKKTIEEMSNKFLKQNIDVRFNVIGYKDVCDRNCNRVKISNFTKNPLDIIDFLSTIESTCGGDKDDIFGALQIAILQPWQKNSKKVVVIITDYPSYGSNTSNYPLPYDVSKLPIDIAKELNTNNIQVFLLYIEKNTLGKISNFLQENKVSTTIASIINEPWQFSLIVPDYLTCMSIDIEKENNFLIDGLDGPLSSTFFQLHKGLSEETLRPLIENCFNSGMKDAMRLVLYIRDRTGDIKEKDLGRNAFWIIRELDLSFASKYYKEFINDVGCFNDLLHLSVKADNIYGQINHNELLFMAVATIQCYLKNIDTEKGQKILSEMSKTKQYRHSRLKLCLNKSSLSKITNSNGIDVLPYYIYKWLPKFGTSKKRNGKKKLKKWERENKFATRLSKLMFVHINDVKLESEIDNLLITIPSRQIINFLNLPVNDNPERESLYREIYTFLGKLCENLPIEVPMCAGDWTNGVNPSKATYGAQKKYKKCFAKRVPDKLKNIQYSNFNITLNGYDMTSYFSNNFLCNQVGENYNSILENDFVNSQWETFKNKNKLIGNFSFQLDCSGSMLCGNPTPLSLALSLFLLSGEKKYITFENPEWQNVTGNTLEENISSILLNNNGLQGNIAKGVELSMSQEVQPDVHFVLTDGRYPNMNLLEAIKVRNKLNKGNLTRVIILNLCNCEKLLIQKPNISEGEEIYVVSGHSPMIIKLFLNGTGSIEEQIRKMLREKFPLEE